MAQEAFPGIGPVPFVDSTSREPLGFRHYRPDELVEGKPMKDHLRFASCYWHTMRNGLADLSLPSSQGICAVAAPTASTTADRKSVV